MHSAIVRTSGIIHSLPLYLISEVNLLITDLPLKLQEIHNVVTHIIQNIDPARNLGV